MQKAIAISASTLVSSLGHGRADHLRALTAHQTGLRHNFTSIDTKLEAFYGEVSGLEDTFLPDRLHHYHCRNHQLAWLAMNTDGFYDTVKQAVERYGAHRIGVAVGTSTSGILQTEQWLLQKSQQDEITQAPNYQHTHRMDALAGFCSEALGLKGPSLVISTACSSSAKVFATATRWMAHDLVDAVVVGGVDSLCLTTIHGFNALGLISDHIVRPLDRQRDGINIGEAGGFMLLEKKPPSSPLACLSGTGESSDAYHISAPHPEGEGAQIAMQKALSSAGLSADDIDYLNLHGTGTPSNDLSESKAVHQVFGSQHPILSSTKGYTGHTLGAAGISEAVFCQIALEEQLTPANLNLQQPDPELGLSPVLQTQPARVQHAMSNSFGFGGNNATLIFSLTEAIQLS